ncbi:MAG: hypothetical protein LBV16_08190 [Elusimicrobiota bacterium]|jgi:hypothetical protein|nr:hypothetical protein [Elusimicrobiota bacterium]
MKKIICFLLVLNVISVIATNVFALTDAEYNKLIGYLGKKVPNGFEMFDVNTYIYYSGYDSRDIYMYKLFTNDKGVVREAQIIYLVLNDGNIMNKRVSAIKKLQSLGYTFVKQVSDIAFFESKKYIASLQELAPRVEDGIRVESLNVAIFHRPAER